MKVTVSKFLQVHVGKPSFNASFYQYLAPGSEVEIDDAMGGLKYCSKSKSPGWGVSENIYPSSI